MNSISKRPYSRHGMSQTKEFQAWHSMRQRCYNPNYNGYENWGGRGIKVCSRWSLFKNFYEDVGVKPSRKHSLDRIDNDGNYEPGNVRWATRSQQNANMRKRCDRITLTIDGITKSRIDWAIDRGISYQTLCTRLRRGWDAKRALGF